MARKTQWTWQEDEYLSAHFADATNEALAQALEKTSSAVKSRARILRLRKSAAFKATVSRKNCAGAWTAVEEQYLALHFPDIHNKEIAAALGKTVMAVRGKADAMGLHKSALYKEANTARFKPGHKTWNRGLKGLQIGGIETRFKPGFVPKNHLPVGSITTRKHKGTGHSYAYIKTAEPRTWRFLQHVRWEEAGGYIPKGCVLKCKTTNTLNCDPDNWEVITRGEHATRKRWPHWKHLPEPIKEVVRLRWQIINTARETRRDTTLHSK